MNRRLLYPVTIVMDRYNGTYSGAFFTAWNLHLESVPREIEDDDVTCCNFWSQLNEYGDKVFVGKGNTPDEAFEDLKQQFDNYYNEKD